MTRVQYPDDFALGIRWLLASDLVRCLLTIGSLGGVLLVILAGAGLLTPAGVMMTVASMFLGAAYYVSFLLMGMAKTAQLATATGVCFVAHLTIASWVPPTLPLADTMAFAFTSAALLCLFVAVLLRSATQPRTHA